MNHPSTFASIRALRAIFFSVAVSLCASFAFGAGSSDAELTNYKSGIDVTFGGTKGTDYYEEYFFHDKLSNDAKVVYLKSITPISMSHNARNLADYPRSLGGTQAIGANGKDGLANSGDEGVIRYKIDRDRQVYQLWSMNWQHTNSANLAPAYSSPFTLATQTYDGTTAIVGTTGSNGGPITSKSSYYYRGILDSIGDEWHVLTYADDDRAMLESLGVDEKFWASDAKSVLLVVNPKTPCFTARVSGTGQFYTTRPKASWTPKIVAQTTYLAPGTSGTVSIELRDINGNNVYYRINGGSFINAGASSVIIPDSAFSNGNNTLEYYYAGNAAYTKTRAIVKNPPFPSAKESHGNYLWGDTAGYNAIAAPTTGRIRRAPYAAYYNNYKTSGVFSNSGQADWDLYYHLGKRGYPGSDPLINAFVAKVEGFNYTRSGAPKSYGQYTKEMLLENSRTQDPVGFELSHSSDASGNRELHAFGYYDAVPVIRTAFAYDIMVANFRSDQVTGGLTAIEDYFVRDTLANFAYEAMQWSMDGTAFGPGMWGGPRMMCSAIIAMIMPEYSTPYFGTSGFGNVQTTYPLCPYQDAKLTWKGALFDSTKAIRTAYPNVTWGIPISDNPDGENIVWAQGEQYHYQGMNYSEGDWGAKAGYFDFAQVGQWFGYWSNMTKMWGGGVTNSRLEATIDRATKGIIWSTDAVPAQFRSSMLLNLNARWPNAVANAGDWVKTLPSTDSRSFQQVTDNAHVFSFAWYDDQITTTTTNGVAPSNAKVNVSVSGP